MHGNKPEVAVEYFTKLYPKFLLKQEVVVVYPPENLTL